MKPDIEMLLNIIITIGCVSRFGLVGVAIGTLISLLYRTIYLIIYMPKIIEGIHFSSSLKLLIPDLMIYTGAYYLGTHWLTLSRITYYSWVVLSIKAIIITITLATILHLMFNSKRFKETIRYVFKKSD